MTTPTQDQAQAAMFRLATGTSNYELDQRTVLKFIGFEFVEVPTNFQRAIEGLMTNLRATIVFASLHQKES